MGRQEGFYARPLFFRQLAGSLQSLTDGKHRRVQGIPPGRKPLGTRTVGHRLPVCLFPGRTHRPDGQPYLLHLILLPRERLHLMCKSFLLFLPFRITGHFLLQAGDKFLPAGLPVGFPRNESHQRLPFLHTLGNGEPLPREGFLQHTEFRFQTGHGLVGLLHLPVPLLPVGGQHLACLGQPVQPLLQILGLLPLGVQPATNLLLCLQRLFHLRHPVGCLRHRGHQRLHQRDEPGGVTPRHRDAS